MNHAESMAVPLAEAQAAVESTQAAARARSLALREPPDAFDPRTCCGRGCHPCMYTYYFDAVDAWLEDAKQRLDSA